MYQNVYFDGRTIHLWDDKLGYKKFPNKRYAFLPDKNGNFVTPFQSIRMNCECGVTIQTRNRSALFHIQSETVAQNIEFLGLNREIDN